MVRLSMEIRPTSFTLEHIPKTLSPTGNITSAPKEFAVYVSVLGPGGSKRSPPTRCSQRRCERTTHVYLGCAAALVRPACGHGVAGWAPGRTLLGALTGSGLRAALDSLAVKAVLTTV